MSSNYDGGFLGPYVKALQLHGYIQDLKFRREQQAQQRLEWQQGMEQQKRQNAMQDFQTHMVLAQHGYTPAEPGATPEGDAGVIAAMRAGGGMAPGGERNLTPTPVGPYRAPSQQDQQRQAQSAYDMKNPTTMIGLGDNKTMVPVPRNQAGTIQIGQYEKQQERNRKAAEDKYKAEHPDLNIHYVDDGKGNNTMIARDKKTGKVVNQETTAGIGKVNEGQQPIPGYGDKIDKYVDLWRGVKDGKIVGGYYKGNITQKEFDLANSEEDPLTPADVAAKEHASNKKAKLEQELYKRAEDRVKEEGKGQQAQQAAAPQVAKPKSINAVQLTAVFKQRLAMEPGLTMPEFKRRLAREGIELTAR
jgi:peptidoglycan hydrolase-like protein with peptidoglycan-binding domain